MAGVAAAGVLLTGGASRRMGRRQGRPAGRSGRSDHAGRPHRPPAGGRHRVAVEVGPGTPTWCGHRSPTRATAPSRRSWPVGRPWSPAGGPWPGRGGGDRPAPPERGAAGRLVAAGGAGGHGRGGGELAPARCGRSSRSTVVAPSPSAPRTSRPTSTWRSSWSPPATGPWPTCWPASTRGWPRRRLGGGRRLAGALTDIDTPADLERLRAGPPLTAVRAVKVRPDRHTELPDDLARRSRSRSGSWPRRPGAPDPAPRPSPSPCAPGSRLRAGRRLHHHRTPGRARGHHGRRLLRCGGR